MWFCQRKKTRKQPHEVESYNFCCVIDQLLQWRWDTHHVCCQKRYNLNHFKSAFAEPLKIPKIDSSFMTIMTVLAVAATLTRGQVKYLGFCSLTQLFITKDKLKTNNCMVKRQETELSRTHMLSGLGANTILFAAQISSVLYSNHFQNSLVSPHALLACLERIFYSWHGKWVAGEGSIVILDPMHVLLFARCVRW